MALTVLSVAYPLAPAAPDVAGGAEQVLLQLDRALVEAGHRSLVIAAEGSEVSGTLIPTPMPAGVLDSRTKGLAQERHACAIRNVLASEHIDVVHMHGIDFHAYLPAPGPAVLVTLHLPLSWYPETAFYPARPNVWFNCVSVMQHAQRPQGVAFLEPIENGVPINPTQSREREDFALYLGRICPEKGVHLAIDAAKRVDVPLIIAGAVFPYEEHLHYFAEEIAPRLDAERRFIGSIGPEQKTKLLASARCLLAPSLVEETSSLAAREALAAGTPVIAFPRQAFLDLIQHGRTGFIADSVAAMGDAIRRVSEIDGELCREAARSRFPLSRMIDSYMTVYEKLACATFPLYAGAA